MSNIKGFTLIELLVVVLIIGILSAIALPQYHKAVTRSKNREAILAIRAIGQGIEMYNLEDGALPNKLNADDVDDLSSFSLDEMWNFSKLNIQPPDSKNWSYVYFCFEGKKCFITASTKREEEVGDINYYLQGRTDEQGHLMPFIYVRETELLEKHGDGADVTSVSQSRDASAETCALAVGRMDPEEGCVID